MLVITFQYIKDENLFSKPKRFFKTFYFKLFVKIKKILKAVNHIIQKPLNFIGNLIKLY